MALRSSDIDKANLRAFGQPGSIGGVSVPLGIIFDRAPAEADPYMDDNGHDGPSCGLLRADLETIGQWPLLVKEIETDGIAYRILRFDDDRGWITLFLRKAE